MGNVDGKIVYRNENYSSKSFFMTLFAHSFSTLRHRKPYKPRLIPICEHRLYLTHDRRKHESNGTKGDRERGRKSECREVKKKKNKKPSNLQIIPVSVASIYNNSVQCEWKSWNSRYILVRMLYHLEQNTCRS